MAATNDTDRLREELDTLRADFARLTEAVKATTEHTAQAGVNAARAGAQRARARASELGADLEAQIEQRPYGSVMMAFGLGLVLGKLLDRR